MASPALAALSAAPPSDRHLPLIGPINTPHKHSALEGQGECAEREGREEDKKMVAKG